LDTGQGKKIMVNLKYGDFKRLFSKKILSTSRWRTLVLPPIATQTPKIIIKNKIKIKILNIKKNLSVL
jgi:hypothetical protein